MGRSRFSMRCSRGAAHAATATATAASQGASGQDKWGGASWLKKCGQTTLFSVYYGFLGLTSSPKHEAERGPGMLVLVGFSIFYLLFTSSHTGVVRARLQPSTYTPAALLRCLPRL